MYFDKYGKIRYFVIKSVNLIHKKSNGSYICINKRCLYFVQILRNIYLCILKTSP